MRCGMVAGSYVWDTNGVKYLDAGGGIAVNALGHAHPAIVKTLSEQGSKLMHVSNLYYHEPGARLAERITKEMGGGKVFFCNSGAEANEGMWKLARSPCYPCVSVEPATRNSNMQHAIEFPTRFGQASHVRESAA